MRPEKVGFVGVGGIGRPMAERLAASGYNLIVCDTHEAALEPFRLLGARTVSRASECAGADMVIIMVVDDAQTRAVTIGPEGLADGVDPDRPPRLAIMSTVLPQTVQEIAGTLAGKNVRTIDAPVSGGAIAASGGTLSIMAGGAKQDLQEMAPLLRTLGSRVHHCGGLGSGEAIKILNNMMGITAQFLMTEIVEIARALAIDEAMLVNVMETSSGRTFCTGDFEAQKAFFRYNSSDPSMMRAIVNACRKDMSLATLLAEDADVATPLFAAIASAHQNLSLGDIQTSWRTIAGDDQ